jgi:hypothetical protein
MAAPDFGEEAGVLLPVKGVPEREGKNQSVLVLIIQCFILV